MDKQLKDLRNARWERAFHQVEESAAEDDPNLPDDSSYNDDATNRKATIVVSITGCAFYIFHRLCLRLLTSIHMQIEHIIQASDVAHTMQVSPSLFVIHQSKTALL